MNCLFRNLVVGASCFLSAQPLLADLAYVADFYSDIFSFDTNHVNVPASMFAASARPNNVAFSPDGQTVYLTTNIGGDVYSFPANDPSTMTKLNTTIPNPMGIAISKDGSLGFVAEDGGGGYPGIYSFPTGGTSHVATLLTPIGTPINTPLFITIYGDNAFVGSIIEGNVYSVKFTSTTYDATLIPMLSFGSFNVGGLAISSDGFLYISNAFAKQINRIPLNDLTAAPTLVASVANTSDGLAVSRDGKTVYFTDVYYGQGVFSFPTDQGFPQTPTPLVNLGITNGMSIALQPTPIAPPTGLKGSQKKNDFGLIYERFNQLEWSASSSSGVVGYYVFRNGKQIATVNGSTLSYDDHDIKKGVTNSYSVAAFNALGVQSSFTTIAIN